MIGVPRFYVFHPSHYCERARWALEHMGIAFEERCWAVGLHLPLARRLAKGTTLPILQTGRKIIQGSDLILDWTGIGGADPGVEQRLAGPIGSLVRQYIYSATLDDPKSGIRDLLFEGVPAIQARLGRLAWPVTRRRMMAGMNARPSLTSEIERKLADELDWFDRHVGGRHHLVGDELGRTDITAASLLAPLANPAACHLYHHRKVVLPPRVEETLAGWRTRPGLEWAARLYADHRRRARPSLSIVEDIANADRHRRVPEGAGSAIRNADRAVSSR